MTLIKSTNIKLNDIKILDNDINIQSTTETEIPFFTYDNLEVNKTYEIEVKLSIYNNYSYSCWIYANSVNLYLYLNNISDGNNISNNVSVIDYFGNKPIIFYYDNSGSCYAKIIIKNTTYFKLTYKIGGGIYPIKILKNVSFIKIREI